MRKKNIKHDREFKLKMIKSFQKIQYELKKRKLNFDSEYGLFTISIKENEIMFQIENDDTVTDCWVNLSEYKSFSLCEESINIDEFIIQLDDIIIDSNNLFKIKKKVEKHINDIISIINNSDIPGLEIADEFFKDLVFENIILATDN